MVNSEICNLQSILVLVESLGFKTHWGNGGLVITEQRRIIKRKWDGRRSAYTMYGISGDELKKLGANKDLWGMSLILGGPPFWTAYSWGLAREASLTFGIPIEEGE